MTTSQQSSPAWEHINPPMTPLEMPSSPSSDIEDPVHPPLDINVVNPYTPAPSPQPFIAPPDVSISLSTYNNSPFLPKSRSQSTNSDADDQVELLQSIQSIFVQLTSSNRKRILADLLAVCDIEHLVFISNVIAPRLKRDFLRELPVEIALHILTFIDDPRTLARASCVSRFWRNLLADEFTWKVMCAKYRFEKSMWEAYRSAMEGNMSWEARKVMMVAPAATDALTSAMEATAMVDDARMHVDAETEAGERAMSISGGSNTDGGDNESRATVSGFQTSMVFGGSPAFASPQQSNAIAGPSRPSPIRPVIDTRRALMASVRANSLRLPKKLEEQFSFKKYFKLAYLTEANWRRGGRVLKSHTSADDGVVTSVAMNDEWIVAGLVNHRIHVFAADTGAHVRTLVGHTQGVWCLVLVSKGGSPAAATYAKEAPRYPRSRGNGSGGGSSSAFAYDASTNAFGFTSGSSAQNTNDAGLTSSSGHSIFGHAPHGSSSNKDKAADDAPDPAIPQMFGAHLKQTDVCNTSVGWGQATSLVVSGGCDRDLRVWDVATGYCLHSLKGHTSTIRCLKVLDGRPIAVSGSRDSTLRVWDIQKGRCLHLLSGHTNSVRCLDVAGNIAVSGSYDCTARLWNVDTGECLRVFEGHYHQIYAVAFDGIRVATGSLDSTVRVWSPETGVCTALLQGHTSLVGQLQLSGDTLISGGSDGRVIIFSLKSTETRFRLCAHDNSVTCLQFDDRFLITGGNDGHVKLFEVETGTPIRELTEPCEAVWRVAFKKDKCVIMCKRGGKTVMEILSFRPPEEAL
ncbi:hypothetical protein M407DRAFT_151474 [Tulasnella calospora MUT 4182]|uniref:F-box domain-containing protein n=1 Tax=Tulasnella calospora MUT 4182 TaxID=1051891 RepID=A0A0C3LJC7_9AGAM|nr:hypothetical protein M407DRAFT_151474 [Tulasnella calospora MUT 4182]